MLAVHLLWPTAVFKVFVISTALALSLGHPASLLCRVWCQLEVAGEASCHEDAAASASATLQSFCCDIAAPAVFTTDIQSHVPQDAGVATLVSPLPPFRVLGSVAHGAVEPSRPFERVPRIFVLRI